MLSRMKSEAPPSSDNTSHTPLFTLACLMIVIWGLVEGRSFLLPVFIAAFLAFLMAPLHRILMKHLKIPDVIAVILSAVVFLSPLVLLGFLLAQQGKGLVHDVPALIASGQVKLQELTLNNPMISKLGLDAASVFEKLSSSLGQGVGMLVGGLATVADVGSQMVLIFVFSILFLASRIHLRRSGEHILARTQGINGPSLLDQSTDLIQRFLVARMAIVAIVGVLATLALKLLGVKYSIFLGSFFGVLTLVPAVGSLMAIFTATVTAIITGHSIGSALLIASVLLGISCVENYLLTPKLVGNRLNLNAMTCFIGLFAGGLMWGVWGMFLSVPILGVLRIAFAGIPSLQPWGELLADKTDVEPLKINTKR